MGDVGAGEVRSDESGVEAPSQQGRAPSRLAVHPGVDDPEAADHADLAEVPVCRERHLVARNGHHRAPIRMSPRLRVRAPTTPAAAGHTEQSR